MYQNTNFEVIVNNVAKIIASNYYHPSASDSIILFL